MYFTPDEQKKFNEIIIEKGKRYCEQNEVDLNALSEKFAQGEENLQVHAMFIKDIDRAVGKPKLFLKDNVQGVSDILQPTKNYMCIDAETVEEHQREAQTQDDKSIYVQLLPLSG
ncbi:MAG: hypothetical protein EZS28_033738 [Streblomastix strix]|uniref:Uncharacterized protein n=1 Tax=Streblomastix strix TaxID=222440 RepID=A0A5J4ULY9_9EUKA|nr:MAG: hypothetical protein EZS28_033738 [Streblomastix strix]